MKRLLLICTLCLSIVFSISSPSFVFASNGDDEHISCGTGYHRTDDDKCVPIGEIMGVVMVVA